MRRPTKSYQTPARAWQKDRMERERVLMRKYGLKTKKELWREETKLRRYRETARGLIASRDESHVQSLKDTLFKKGIGEKDLKLEDVLELQIEQILNRRLQSIIVKKGLARTSKEARQMIAHKKAFVGNRAVDVPSYPISREEESMVQVSE